jgi:hypothetical protein
LHHRRFLRKLLPCFAACTLIATTASAFPTEDQTPDASSNWLEMLSNLPIVGRYLTPKPVIPPVTAQVSTCEVEPLPPILDAEAVSFEREQIPDTGGLLPAMAQALAKFQRLVTAAGGTYEVKSAYRPAAYQEHLQQVWFKWMRELRSNREAGCQALRAEVSDEFSRHHLLESQMPVTSSDHTRGMAVDIAVVIPKTARKSKRRYVSLDRLALLAGLKRPDIRRDPVHFKLVTTRAGRKT